MTFSRGLVFGSLVYSFSAIAAATYTMSDLQALSVNGRWAELVEHLQDVPPAKRDQTWNALAGNAVQRHFEQLVKKGDDAAAYEFLDGALPHYPFLKTDSDFMKQRADVGLRYLDACFSYDDDSCHRQLLGFVIADPNPMLAFTVASQIRKRLSDIKAIEYYKTALEQKPNGEVCRDEDLRLSLAAAIRATPGGNAARAAQDVAFGYCFDGLVDVLNTAIKDDENAKRNACGLMHSKHALSGIAGKKCKAFIDN